MNTIALHLIAYCLHDRTTSFILTHNNIKKNKKDKKKKKKKKKKHKCKQKKEKI